MTDFQKIILVLALVMTGALFLCLYFLIKQTFKIQKIEDEAKPLNGSLLSFSKELGEIKASTQSLENFKLTLGQVFKDQESRLKPIDEGMSHLISYFGSLKKSAGKVGELTFDLLIEQLPPGKILRNINFENQGRLEFLLEVGGEWVPVDSKFSKNPKVYFKKAVEDVSKKYLGQKIIGTSGEAYGVDLNSVRAASYGLVFFPSDESLFEVYKDDKLRQLMLDKRVWAVSPSNFYWQLFYFRWFESQIEKAKDSQQIIKSMNLGILEVNNSLEKLELIEKQSRQSLVNFEKMRKALQKVIRNFNQDT